MSGAAVYDVTMTRASGGPVPAGGKAGPCVARSAPHVSQRMSIRVWLGAAFMNAMASW